MIHSILKSLAEQGMNYSALPKLWNGFWIQKQNSQSSPGLHKEAWQDTAMFPESNLIRSHTASSEVFSTSRESMKSTIAVLEI